MCKIINAAISDGIPYRVVPTAMLLPSFYEYTVELPDELIADMDL